MTSCGTISRPEPAYIQDPGGNAWVITIPKEASIVGMAPESLVAASNEISPDGKLKVDCVIVSQSYLQIRDEREIMLIKEIELLKVKGNQ